MLLNHCRLIKELSGGIETADGALRMENGKIAEVMANAAPADACAGEEVIDCQGKTLLPGLMDTHTHIIGIVDYSSDLMKSPMKLFMKSAAAAQKYLPHSETAARRFGFPILSETLLQTD